MDNPNRISRAEDCGWYWNYDYWTDFKDWLKRLKAGDKQGEEKSNGKT